MCAVLALLGDRIGRWVFALAAAPMALSAGWAGWSLGQPSTVSADLDWVAELGLVFALRADALSGLLAVIVSGIGVLVCTYAAGYFAAGTEGLGRFAATILAFSTAMLGLVLADTAFTLFAFWELTSVTSFLLVGHKRLDAVARTAARRAFAITASGGLVLLAGLVLLNDGGIGTRLSDLAPTDGPRLTAAAVLIMIAAATKSAQVPFHMWLPGAMAAPTPVSAYLHSATMVKAGVVLVAIMSPAFADVAVWSVMGIVLGGASMLWGAIGALRQHDAKLVLAWGTISQLGLMILLLSLGSAKATFAGLSILTAHAIFKAALFMVVGEVDVRTGTRDVRELGGLRHSMPVAFFVAVISGGSMAGVPPLLGFPAKEAAIEAGLGLAGTEKFFVLAIVVVGSVLTVAYTFRLIVSLFFGAAKADVQVAASRPNMALPTVLLAVLSVAGFVALGWVTDRVRAAAVTLDDKSVVYSLLRWPGLTTAFVISMVIVAVGSVVGFAASRLDRDAPASVGADLVDGGLDRLVVVARRVAATVQHGSLPGYLLVITVMASAATIPFWASIDTSEVVLWDNPAQGVLVAMLVVAVFAATRVSSRMGAALVLGAVGLIVSSIFVAHGALDLVLTQLLVETVVVVGFVLGLGRLAQAFPAVGSLWMSARIAVSAIAAFAVGAALLASGTSPRSESRSTTLSELGRDAVADGGGKNLVNVILTDIRALDTLGEVVVLITVAVGVLALTRVVRDDDTIEGENA